jgi:anti-sigma factor RsiW
MTEAARNLSETEMADLAALADGTLPDERRPTVEAWVAASPELQELLERQRHALTATQGLAEEPVPESLRAAVEPRRQVRDRRRSPLAGLAPRLAVAGAVAAALVAVLAVVLSGGPGAPSVAEAAQLGARAPSEPAPGPADDGGTKLALDVEGVVFPDFLRSYGWEAVGMRRDEIDGRDATTVFYEKGGRRIAYVIVAGSGLPRPAGVPSTMRDGVLFHTLEVDERQAVTWRRLGRTCILIGPVSEDELLTLASWRGDGTLRY